MRNLNVGPEGPPNLSQCRSGGSSQSEEGKVGTHVEILVNRLSLGSHSPPVGQRRRRWCSVEVSKQGLEVGIGEA